MQRTMSICTGEAAVPRPFTSSEYMYECDPEFMVTFFCSYYGVDEPRVRENPAPRGNGFAGRYYPGTDLLCFNRRYTGLLIHELAHCLIHKLHIRDDRTHGREFSRLLQEMIDLWR